MKLTKRNGVYVLDWRDPMGKRKRKSLGTRDLVEAERRAHDMMTGKDVRSDVWTLAQALEHTYSSVWQHQKSWETKASIVKLLTADLGHLPLADVTYSVLNEYAHQLYGEDKAPATINRRLTSIGKALREAVKMGKLQSVPEVPIQPENNKRTRWLTHEEESRLLGRCDVLVGREMKMVSDLIVFLIDTGARLGEALKLRPDHVGQDSVLFEDTKARAGTIKHRRVPLTTRARVCGAAVARYSNMGVMLNKDQLERRLSRVRQAAGLADVTFHTLRHTCASRLIQRGASMHEVRDWLGHSSVKVTERYAHLADSSLSHLTDLLNPVTQSPGVSSVGHSASNVSHFPGSRKAGS